MHYAQQQLLVLAKLSFTMNLGESASQHLDMRISLTNIELVESLIANIVRDILNDE